MTGAPRPDDALLAAQAQVLEMIVRGHALPDVLGALCKIVERAAASPVRATILLTEVDGRALRTTDDPQWTPLSRMPPGLVAAWSMPIRSSTGSLLGTFGTYFAEEREPLPHERQLVEVLVHTAALAIERDRADHLLRDVADRQRFLADLAAATQVLSEPAEVMATSARLLAEHLEVDRCAYAEVEDERVFHITGDHTRGVPSIVGRWEVAAFGQACVDHMREGTAYVVEDAANDPRITPADLVAYRATHIGAVVCMPLHKAGRFTAAMAVHQRTPRRWQPREIELIGIVVGRCWEALERSRGITARMLADRALADSRARLDYAVRLSGVGFWYCDLPFDELIWDPRVKDHFFLPPDARVTIDLFYERIHGDDRQATREAIDTSISQHRSYDVVYRTVDPATGSIKWVRALGGAAYGPDGSPTRFDGVTVDVTSHKRDEERLAGVARAALTIHSTGSLASVIGVVTEEARVLIGAHRAVTVVRTDGEPPLGAIARSSGPRSPSEVIEPAAADAVLQRVTRPMRLARGELAAGPPWPALLGATAPVHGVLAVPFVGRDGACFGFLEISDKLEGELGAADEAIAVQLAQLAVVAIENARLYDQLRDQDRRKDEFLATLAHELRNPLAPIRTGLHVLQHDVTAEQSTHARAMMERQLVHLVRMVDDLLEISRVTLGKIQLQRTRVELATVLDSALETTRSLVEARRHALVVDLPRTPVPIDVDPTRLSQVFANLINNAAKYTPDGGRIEITAEVAGPTLTVRIRDTGVGIPADMLPFVFDMFTQVGRSIERSQGGLGIGLTLVRRLIEMHGGTVAAQSPGPALGSTFVVTLPVAEAQAPADQREDTVAAAPGLRVLVVDDNVDAAEMLAMLLELRGHHTRLAHTGPAALEVAAELDPELVFLDIGLPGLNGYEVARRLRATATGTPPMLVAVTGWGTDEDRRQAAAAGFDRHLVKPVDLAKLEAALRDVRHRAR